MKLLLVEDEQPLSDSIAEYLRGDGYRCETASTWAVAEEKLGMYTYDCVLLDLTLPGGNGLDLLRKLRAGDGAPDTGVIIISARDALDDKIAGLDLGADDYLAKPFHLSELNARLRSVVRRRKFQGASSITFNDITIHPEEKSVFVRGERVVLTKKEFDLLIFFIANKSRVITKAAIAGHLWGDDMDMSDSYDFIYSHIKNLRRKIVEKGGGDYIQTVYGSGYRWSDS